MNEELRNVLLKYMSAEDVESALREDRDVRSLIDRDICFVIVEVTAQEESGLLKIIESVTELSGEHNGLPVAMVSNLMVVVFGLVEPLKQHESFINVVLARHGEGVKLVYAAGPGRIGNLGSKRFMSYSFIHPAFPRALALLPSVAVGEAREVR